jgi:hypothetical protein
MNKYRVELAGPAVSMYTYLSAHSGTKDSTEIKLLHLLDEIIDEVMPFRPFDSGTELGGRLAGVYWISQDTLHIFYGASPKPRTVVILSIWDGPNSEAHLRQADILCTQMVFSGKFRELLDRRASAN